MSNNCLVTKLQGVVNNDNLPKLGVYSVKFGGTPITNNGIGVCVHDTTSPCVITSRKNSLTKRNSSVIIQSFEANASNLDGGSMCKSAVAGDIIDISNKYNIDGIICIAQNDNNISGGTLKLDELAYSSIEKLTFVINDKNSFKLEELIPIKYTLKQIDLRGAGITGDLSIFDDVTTITSATFAEDTTGARVNTLITGSIMSFANSTNIETLDLHGAPSLSSVDIKEFALAQIANGRSSATISIRTVNYGDLVYSFDGVEVPTGRYTLTWTSSNDIALTPNS